MMTEIKDFPTEEKYLIFQALSHPARVKILILLGKGEVSFSSLKHELGMESSGQLQHHLQKLSTLITEGGNGYYRITESGMKALEIFRLTEISDTPLRDLCCLPGPSEIALNRKVNMTGKLVRVSIGSLLSALTLWIVASYLFTGQAYLRLPSIGFYFSLGIGDAILLGFFGASFLISAFTGYPGCEITAIPNMFRKKKLYCSCIMTPFNVPNGSLLQRNVNHPRAT